MSREICASAIEAFDVDVPAFVIVRSSSRRLGITRVRCTTSISVVFESTGIPALLSSVLLRIMASMNVVDQSDAMHPNVRASSWHCLCNHDAVLQAHQSADDSFIATLSIIRFTARSFDLVCHTYADNAGLQPVEW